MSQVFRYVSPGNWSVDLGSSAVRLGQIPGFVTKAELGAAGVSNIILDNPDGTVGHSSDQIVGWKQFTVDENAAPGGNQRTYTGYIGERKYQRRANSSLITGAANEIDITMADLNTLLGLRIVTGTDGNRPSESVTTRVAWILASSYLTGLVYDNGTIDASAVTLDAVDFRGQKPLDVLGDCAIASTYNYFVWYHESNAQPTLWFRNSNTSFTWDSGITISNTLADIDQAAIAAGTATVFYPYGDAHLTRNPDQVFSGVFLPHRFGNSYVTNGTTATNFIARDGSAPNANIKSAAAASAVANLFLTDASTEDDRITCTIQPVAAQANCILAGQLVTVKFSNLPGYTSAQLMRVMQRTLAQSTETDEHYELTLELSPTNIYTGSAFAALLRSGTQFSGGVLQYAEPGGAPAAGWYAEPTVAPLSIVEGATPYYHITSSRAMTVRIEMGADISTVAANGDSVTLAATVDGATVGSNTQTSGGGFWAPHFHIDVHNVQLQAGSVVGFSWTSATPGIVNWDNYLTDNTFLRVGRGTQVWNSGAVSWTGP